MLVPDPANMKITLFIYLLPLFFNSWKARHGNTTFREFKQSEEKKSKRKKL